MLQHVDEKFSEFNFTDSDSEDGDGIGKNIPSAPESREEADIRGKRRVVPNELNPFLMTKIPAGKLPPNTFA